MIRRAFTLIEVLVAISLVGALVGSMFIFLFNMMQARQRSISLTQEQRTAAVLFERLERDLACCVAGDRGAGAGVSGDERSLRLLTRGVPAALAERGADDPAAFADLERSEYRFVGGEEGEGEQEEEEEEAEEQEEQEEQEVEGDQPRRAAEGRGGEDEETVSAGPGVIELRRGVVGLAGAAQSEFQMLGQAALLRFRYHDGGEWVDQYDSLDARALPRAVEVAIWFTPPAEDALQTTPPDRMRVIIVPDPAGERTDAP
jgi:prepilin-type N-terminal cleavage/methylation domain-containing protein